MTTLQETNVLQFIFRRAIDRNLSAPMRFPVIEFRAPRKRTEENTTAAFFSFFQLFFSYLVLRRTRQREIRRINRVLAGEIKTCLHVTRDLLNLLRAIVPCVFLS